MEESNKNHNTCEITASVIKNIKRKLSGNDEDTNIKIKVWAQFYGNKLVPNIQIAKCLCLISQQKQWLLQKFV